MMHRTTTSSALNILFIGKRTDPASGPGTSTRRLLKGCDALTHIAIVNVHLIDLGKSLQSRRRLARRLLGHTQIIPQCEGTFRVEVRGAQRAVVPNSGNTRLPLFHESQSEKRAALHGVTE